MPDLTGFDYTDYVMDRAELESCVQSLADRSRRRSEALRARRAELLARLPEVARVLVESFGCTRVALLGSLRSGELFDERSDVDLAVWGLAKERYFSALAEAEERLGAPVDLIPYEEATESMRRTIDRTAGALS